MPNLNVYTDGVTTERDAMKAVLLELLTAEIALKAWRRSDGIARDGLVVRARCKTAEAAREE